MKKRILIIICAVVLIAGGTAFGIVRYRHYNNATVIREKQEQKKQEREKQRKENLENGVSPTKKLYVPDLTGLTVDEAQKKLDEAGFSGYFYSITETDSDMKKGLIVKATPPAGSSFYEGNTVSFDFEVSK